MKIKKKKLNMNRTYVMIKRRYYYDHSFKTKKVDLRENFEWIFLFVSSHTQLQKPRL